MFTIENIPQSALSKELLRGFQHRQCITKKYVYKEGGWEIEKVQELRQWSDEKREWLVDYLGQQIARGGSLLGAFQGNIFAGFASVDGCLYGKTANYANLTLLFVDDRFQRQGIGRSLFWAACGCAAQKGANKLFISAIPAVETVAFYFSLGCTDAKEIIDQYVDTPNDRYLEYKIT